MQAIDLLPAIRQFLVELLTSFLAFLLLLARQVLTAHLTASRFDDYRPNVLTFRRVVSLRLPGIRLVTVASIVISRVIAVTTIPIIAILVAAISVSTVAIVLIAVWLSRLFSSGLLTFAELLLL